MRVNHRRLTKIIYLLHCSKPVQCVYLQRVLLFVCQVLDHLCFLGKLKDKGYSSNDAAAALLLFDNSSEKVGFKISYILFVL